MLTADNAAIEDVIRIREKQFAAMEKMMTLAEKDEILKEQINTTYQNGDMVAWKTDILLHSPHPQFARLRENPKYMELLNKWAHLK